MTQFAEAQLETPPPILYKYCPPERLEDLIWKLSVRFTNPLDFNDNFDSHYRIAHKKLSRAQQEHRESLGVLCLTADPDNHLMWVNYAAQHTGFVVGFKTSDHCCPKQS
jgi:hypothetical protein